MPHKEITPEIQLLAKAAGAAVLRTSLRSTARAIGISPTGLKKVIDGASPYSPTVRRLKKWYMKSVAPVLPHTTEVETQMGLYEKFHVTRADGGSLPGGKHEDCEYFVLDLDHDPYAQAALRAYALACVGTHPALARELWDKTRLMGEAPPAQEFPIDKEPPNER